MTYTTFYYSKIDTGLESLEKSSSILHGQDYIFLDWINPKRITLL